MESVKVSTRASAMLAELAKEPLIHSQKVRIRALVLDLIQQHNLFDVYGVLKTTCDSISTSQLLVAYKQLPERVQKEVATLIYSSSILQIHELGELVRAFSQVWGRKVVDNMSRRDLVNERVVSKLSIPVSDTLVEGYIRTIFAKSHSNTSAASGKESTDAPSPLVPSKDQPSVSSLSPVLPIRLFRPNPRLEIAFDVRSKNPLYVLEQLNGLSRVTPIQRPNFYEEQTLPAEFRSKLCSFLHSGFDRGHMAPAADFGEASVLDTFNTCNIAPQNHILNISIWAKLEKWCRKISEDCKCDIESTTYVVTGPVWLPTAVGVTKHKFEFDAIGRAHELIHVPTHFFKLVAVVIKGRVAKFAPFLVPNEEPSTEKQGFLHFFVPWEKLEAISGLQFFPKFTRGKWRLDARKATEQFLQSLPDKGGDASRMKFKRTPQLVEVPS